MPKNTILTGARITPSAEGLKELRSRIDFAKEISTLANKAKLEQRPKELDIVRQELKLAEEAFSQGNYWLALRHIDGWAMRKGVRDLRFWRPYEVNSRFKDEAAQDFKLKCSRIVSPLKLDSSDWTQANFTASFRENMQGETASIPTRAGVAWDDKNLYVLFDCAESHPDLMKANAEKRDGAVTADDSVELFLAVQPERLVYKQFIVNWKGALLDQERTASTAGVTVRGPAWDSQARVWAGKTSDGWAVTLAIPWTDLAEHPPKQGDTWAVNFGRTRYITGAAEYFSWSPTGGSFHMPEKFGTMQFINRGKRNGK